MSDISGTLEDFKWLMQEGVQSEATAALLVLASRVECASAFRKNNAENFGHELGMAIKECFPTSFDISMPSSFNISLDS
jgi:hypothetical protein